jgi:ribonuclease P protein component
MLAPADPGTAPTAGAPDPGPAAVSLCVLQLRADYLRAASARKQGMPGFLLQARDRQDGEAAVRVGFTASKKIGNAVARNRAKRRMRALAREVLAPLARAGWDYVLVARPGATVTRGYADLCADLTLAVAQVHRAGRPGARG